MHVGQEDQQTGELLAALDDAEFGRLLDRVDRVAAGIGETDDLGARGLRLQQIGREIRRVQRMPHLAQHLAAVFLDDGGGVALQRMPERIIDGDKEPGVAARLDDGAAGAVGERDRVVGPVHRGRGAGFAGQIGRGGAGDQDDLVLGPRHLLHRQRDARRGQVGDHIDPVLVEPFAGDRGGDIGLVLMVGADDFDLLAVQRAAEIGDGHFDRLDRAGAGKIGIKAGHVGQHADLDRILRDLRPRRGRRSAAASRKRRITSVSRSLSLFSDPEILVNLVEVPGQFRVADHVDHLAVLDDVMPVGDRRRKVKILFDQQDRKPLRLQRFDDARRSAAR